MCSVCWARVTLARACCASLRWLRVRCIFRRAEIRIIINGISHACRCTTNGTQRFCALCLVAVVLISCWAKHEPHAHAHIAIVRCDMLGRRVEMFILMLLFWLNDDKFPHHKSVIMYILCSASAQRLSGTHEKTAFLRAFL